MKKRVLIGLVLGIGLLCAACTSFQASGLQMTPGAQNSDYQILGTFEKKVTVWKFLGTAGGPTLANIMSDASDDVIKKTITDEVRALGGTSAINVKIVYGASFPGLLGNVITFAIVAPASVTVSGTVVKER